METLAALADPTRRRILELLADGELDAGAVASRFKISRPAISRHLRVLREAGLVAVRSEGTRRIYRMAPAPLRELDEWLERYRGFWTDRLDALEAHVRRRVRDKEEDR